MIAVNSYFDDAVKSLSFETPEGKASTGVMKPGQYTFGTSCKEIMKVTAGMLAAKLPGEEGFSNFPEGTQFEVEANVEFEVKCDADVAYVCLYR